MKVYKKVIYVKWYLPETAEDCGELACDECVYEDNIDCSEKWDTSETLTKEE